MSDEIAAFIYPSDAPLYRAQAMIEALVSRGLGSAQIQLEPAQVAKLKKSFPEIATVKTLPALVAVLRGAPNSAGPSARLDVHFHKKRSPRTPLAGPSGNEFWLAFDLRDVNGHALVKKIRGMHARASRALPKSMRMLEPGGTTPLEASGACELRTHGENASTLASALASCGFGDAFVHIY